MSKMQKLFEKRELEKQGYSVSVKGFITILEQKNLTEQTSGIVTFGREVVRRHRRRGKVLEINARMEKRTPKREVEIKIITRNKFSTFIVVVS